jgi:hypothetical protein
MGQQPPATAERCRLLLEQWCSGLTLSGRERSLFAGQLAHLERQLRRLQRRQLRLAVFGRGGVFGGGGGGASRACSMPCWASRCSPPT